MSWIDLGLGSDCYSLQWYQIKKERSHVPAKWTQLDDVMFIYGLCDLVVSCTIVHFHTPVKSFIHHNHSVHIIYFFNQKNFLTYVYVCFWYRSASGNYLRRFMLRFSAWTLFWGLLRPLALFIIYFYYIILLFPKQ